MKAPAHAPAEPFFLPTPHGERFCLYHLPAGACRGAVLYVHPFAEEMNKSRRMAALQARALAASGFGVLLIDLEGCGDSGGDFGDARWEHWKADLASARAWLLEREGQPVSLLGLRLGALLALDYARTALPAVERIVLWQPVLQGAPFLTQFLRLRVAGEMLGDGGTAGGTKELRARLAAGEALEVAGYQLDPQLAAAIDALDATGLPPFQPVDWFEIVATDERPIPPAAERHAARWAEGGAAPSMHKIVGEAFWSTQEIAECLALVDATCAVFSGKAA